jgi:hypothetical protein
VAVWGFTAGTGLAVLRLGRDGEEAAAAVRVGTIAIAATGSGLLLSICAPVILAFLLRLGWGCGTITPLPPVPLPATLRFRALDGIAQQVPDVDRKFFCISPQSKGFEQCHEQRHDRRSDRQTLAVW